MASIFSSIVFFPFLLTNNETIREGKKLLGKWIKTFPNSHFGPSREEDSCRREGGREGMRDREINEKGKIGQLQRGRESLRRKGGLRRCGDGAGRKEEEEEVEELESGRRRGESR